MPLQNKYLQYSFAIPEISKNCFTIETLHCVVIRDKSTARESIENILDISVDVCGVLVLAAKQSNKYTCGYTFN